MPERFLREQTGAFPQRMNRIETRQRALSLRAWGSALRSAKANTSAPLVFYQYVQALAITVPSGRWEIHADVTFSVAAASGTENFYLGIALLDPNTGLAIGSTTIAPRRCLPAAVVGAPLMIPVVLIDEFSAEADAVTVSMITKNTNGGAYTLDAPRLHLLPV